MNTRNFRAVLSCVACAAVLSGCGGYSSSGKTYNPPVSQQVASISVTPTSATIAADGTQQYKAVQKNGSGDTVTGSTISWHSSNPAVATIDSKGLAKAVGAGTTTITATTTQPGGGLYNNGTTQTITSNKAKLTVQAADQVMGMIAMPQSAARTMVLVRDRNGTVQAALADDTGRFAASVAGMDPPYLIQARSRNGDHFYSVTAAAGVANINAGTDFLVRTWFRAKGMNADAAFASPEAIAGPDSDAIKAMNTSLRQAFSSSLRREGLTIKQFSFFDKSYVANNSGYDRLFRELRIDMTPTTLALRDPASGRIAEAAFGARQSAQLRISGAGRARSMTLVAAD
ncbi:MAG TPA: Ig-like domain-containing protein [Gammaproteobacteria bacterium]|nr:Ig-like domain-containing protein [Gammaproteobacteria bacterium]